MLKQKRDVRIVMTGGHAATTGIATIESLRRRYPVCEICWIGPKYEISGSNALSLGYKIYPSLGVKYYTINAGKLQTKITRYTLLHILRIPLGFIQALFLLVKLRPNLILSFGGFSSFPVTFIGYMFRVPIILQEQTVAAGRASMTTSMFATKIALSRETSLQYFPREKSVVIGNPLMRSILSVQTVTTHQSPYTILVMGGSRGSEFINGRVFSALPDLAKHKIIHITGPRDFEKYKRFETNNYKVVEFVDPREMYKYYSQADLIIGRSGANAVSELIFVRRPAILIPLPRTFMGEQVKNAEYAKSLGIATILLETELTPERLKKEIERVFENWESIVMRISEVKSPDVGASERLVALCAPYL